MGFQDSTFSSHFCDQPRKLLLPGARREASGRAHWCSLTGSIERAILGLSRSRLRSAASRCFYHSVYLPAPFNARILATTQIRVAGRASRKQSVPPEVRRDVDGPFAPNLYPSFASHRTLAVAVVDRWAAFQAALTGPRRKYPIEEFLFEWVVALTRPLG